MIEINIILTDFMIYKNLSLFNAVGQFCLFHLHLFLKAKKQPDAPHLLCVVCVSQKHLLHAVNHKQQTPTRKLTFGRRHIVCGPQ